MKRLLVFVCFVVLAVACTPTSNENTSNTNKATETKASAPPSEADIIAKEKGAWDAFRHKDADAFKKTMAPEYIGVGWDGTHDVASSVAAMKDAELTDVTFADWKMTTIDKDAVLITYTATVKGSVKGKAIPDGPYREASAYVNRNGEWVNIYYQETLAHPPMAMPSPSPGKEGTKPAATPGAKPGETGADAEANEKLVWDSFKAKNYEAFASYLADNFTEVEDDAVYDKAASVKSVQGFDASKAELSEWKTVKFDDDASLVTYKVKIGGMKPPMADTGYHSSIWIKRDNKWVALFHMGTPAVEPKATASPEMKPSAETKASPGKKM
ncbi:MAG TPA: nuclear transport factor 2 family protein [Pyrinomonadaceae bacterium]|nr:nuclear transport factor 2 family protein [Pyrinomonadaceae bacterium]